jgi:hypothetical protein
LRDDKVGEGKGHSRTVVYHCSDIVASTPYVTRADECSRHTRDIDQGPSIRIAHMIISRRRERGTILGHVDRGRICRNSTSIVFANVCGDHSRWAEASVLVRASRRASYRYVLTDNVICSRRIPLVQPKSRSSSSNPTAGRWRGTAGRWFRGGTRHHRTVTEGRLPWKDVRDR